jgi:TPR repeat protein
MKSFGSFLFLAFLFIPVGRALPPNSPDQKQAGLIAYAHFKALTPTEQNQLSLKAQSGDAEAQYWMGVLYTEGTVPKNLEEGRRWLLKAAEQGYGPAERSYGAMCARTNPPVGEQWMLRAAEQGDAEAQFWLGFAYEERWFGTTHDEDAVKWYRRAAEAGDPDAQVELGRRYEDGEGVEQDFRLAADWYRRAAEHVPDLGGAGQGRNRLGLLYLNGRGVPQDYTQAYFWFRLRESTTNAEDAKEHLSPPQILAVEKLVDEWKQEHRLSPELEAALNTLEASPR